MGIEGRRGLTLLPGTTQQLATEYGAKNVVAYFSVDGSPVVPRRTVGWWTALRSVFADPWSTTA